MIGTDTFAGTTLGPAVGVEPQPRQQPLVGRQRPAAADRDRHQRPVRGPQHPHPPHPGPDLHRDDRAGLLARCADGDRAGLAMLRDSSAWIGVKRDNGATRVVMTNGLTMDSSWNTTGTGTEAAGATSPAAGSGCGPTPTSDPAPAGRPGSPTAPTGPPSRPRHRVHAEQRLAVLHGLPLRDLQLRHPGPRRRGHGPPLRPHHALANLRRRRPEPFLPDRLRRT